MLSTAFLLAASMVVGQAEASPVESAEQVATQLRPKAVLDYFAGDWLGQGLYGDTGPLHLRIRAEWDLNHNVIVERIEWTTGAGTSLLIKKWDAVSNQLILRWFSTNGGHMDATLKVEPHGEFFKLSGPGTGSLRNQQTSEDMTITIEDENHYIWISENRLRGGTKQKDMIERYRRVGTFPEVKPLGVENAEQPKPKRRKAVTNDE